MISGFSYPKEPKFKWALALCCGLFVYCFLLFFQPFGVNNYTIGDPITTELILGLSFLFPLVFGVVLLNEIFLRPVVRPERSLPAMLAWIAIQFIITGSFTFLAYNWVGNFHDFNLQSYFSHLIDMGSILIFPFIAVLVYFNYRRLQKGLKERKSNQTADASAMVLLSGSYKNDDILLPEKNIICLSSEDNYTAVHYLKDNDPSKHLIRATLSSFEDRLNPDYFIRCNRSIIVNLRQATAMKKKDGDLYVFLKTIGKPVKVSRSRRSTLEESARQFELLPS